MKRIEYKSGDKIGNVYYLNDVEKNKHGLRRARFRCYCGNEFIAIINLIKIGNTNSCGCFKSAKISKIKKKHGDSDSHIYNLWHRIKYRCFNKSYVRYSEWGGRGITMYKPWADNYLLFKKYIVSELGQRPSLKHSLDRINNDGNYEPKNIRWATPKQQSNNRRKRRS